MKHPLVTPEQARDALFKAGWHPTMMGKPVTDPKIRAALLDLNEAEIRRTRARMRAMS